MVSGQGTAPVERTGRVLRGGEPEAGELRSTGRLYYISCNRRSWRARPGDTARLVRGPAAGYLGAVRTVCVERQRDESESMRDLIGAWARGSSLEERYERLVELIEGYGSVCVGYSGGVDSVFLAKVCVDVLGADRVLAVTGRSASYPAVQWEMALECARRFGIPHEELETEEQLDPRYAANPTNRCYYCKSELWSKLTALAAERGYAVVADGSNADDAADFRPGARAGAEWGIRSPLAEAGLTKADIRELSRRHGLPTWDQPAAPCLASRIPYGLAVTPARLQQVERAENAIRALGFREFRVRHHGVAARIEVAPSEQPRALAMARELGRELRSVGFERVLLDVEGYRRGALNEGLPVLAALP